MTTHLYRNIFRRATLAFLLLSFTFAFGQRRYQPPAGPRAVGLIELAPNGAARLVPIIYYENGKFYDARFYRANPAPLVLESDIVYEGQKTGVAEGLFTVSGATNLNGNWYGVGKWSSFADQPKKVEKPKPSITAPVSDEDSDRPVLRRSGKKSESTPQEQKPPSGSSQTQSTSKRDDNAPPPTTENDPDRPRLKKPSNSAETTKETPPAQVEARPDAEREPADDPNRPVLRRGKPIAKQQHEEEVFPGMKPDDTAGTPKTVASGTVSKPPITFKTIIGVSDAKPNEPRPYEFEWSAGERTRYTKELAKLAAAEVAKYASARKIALPKQLDGKTEVRAFDVDYSNSPEIVLTGEYPIGVDSSGQPNEIYVTYVARIGYEDKPEKIFSTVTDTHHLDAWSRLELIDAVDVEGDGRGELLFREYTGDGKRYVIYRASSYELRPLFTGGTGE
jgi:hypothetical protein